MTVTAPSLFSSTTSLDSTTAKLSETFDNFLKILTTQLQHQDPLSPLDATEFTSQLVQFTQVEQSIAANKKLDSLIQLSNTNGITAALSYIGKTVEVIGTAAELENGKAEWKYILESNAKKVMIEILDDSGNKVRTLDGEIDAGEHTLVWNGTDGGGNPLPSGIYTLKITATDANGKAVSVVTTTFGRVTSLHNTENGLRFTVNGEDVPLSNVLAVKDAATL